MNIIFAEDQEIVRNGLKLLLQTGPGVASVKSAANGHEVLEILNGQHEFNLLITDLKMPHMDGTSLIRNIRSSGNPIPIIVLSMYDDLQEIYEVLQDGASAFLLKSGPLEELFLAMQQVTNGRRFISSELSLRILDLFMANVPKSVHQPAINFSERELEILILMGEGQTTAEISERLFISRRTVEGHRQSLLLKTGSKNTATLIKYALSAGIIAFDN